MTQVGEVSPPPHPDLVGEGEVETRQVRWTAVLSGCCWLMDPGLGSLVENFFLFQEGRRGGEEEKKSEGGFPPSQEQKEADRKG